MHAIQRVGVTPPEFYALLDTTNCRKWLDDMVWSSFS
jgi:hypothetical protein